jgi:hypothetical protein
MRVRPSYLTSGVEGRQKPPVASSRYVSSSSVGAADDDQPTEWHLTPVPWARAGQTRYLIKQRKQAACPQLHCFFHRIYESMVLGMHPTKP